MGILELDTHGEGIVTFLVSISKGLKPKDYEALLTQEERDEALVRRKLIDRGSVRGGDVPAL